MQFSNVYASISLQMISMNQLLSFYKKENVNLSLKLIFLKSGILLDNWVDPKRLLVAKIAG